MRFSYRLGIVIAFCCLAVLVTAGMVSVLLPRTLTDVTWIYVPPTLAPGQVASGTAEPSGFFSLPALPPLPPELQMLFGGPSPVPSPVVTPTAQLAAAPLTTDTAVSE